MHPILFTVPGINLPIYSYGVMLGLSLVVGWYIVMYLGSKAGLPLDKLANCYIWTAVSAIAGARLLYVVTNLDEFQGAGLTDVINVRKGGLVAYGGFLGGFVGSWIYLKRARIRLLPWADAVVPTLGSGLGITRIGCLLYGCDYGKPIPHDAPAWIKAIGITFPNWNVAFPDLVQRFKDGVGCMTGSFFGSPAFRHHVAMGLAGPHDARSALVYPTQIMEIVNGWLAFGLTMLIYRRAKFRGQTFLFFTAYYGVTRSLMEMLRGDTQRGGVGLFSTSQAIGMATFVAAVIAWVVLANKAKKDPSAAMSLGSGAEQEAEPSPAPVQKRRLKKKR